MSLKEADYWRCEICQAVFMDSAQLLPRHEELQRYRMHLNDPQDLGYRSFLDRLCRPLLARLTPNQRGLDYGCGSGPALSQMLIEAGHQMCLYDPFFFPDEAVLADSYNFITCTEVAEHFYDPYHEFAKLDQLLMPGSLLAIMTTFLVEKNEFERWYYRHDPTHVVFYNQQTFEKIAQKFGWEYEIACPNVVIMKKTATM